MKITVQIPAPSSSITRSTRISLTRTLAALFLIAGVTTTVQAQAPVVPVTVADAVESLNPGEFIWAPQVAPDGPMMIVVSLLRQRAYVYRNGVMIGISTVSTGSEGRETPTGVFTVLQKHVVHNSNLYNNAPMPFMQRLTWDGIAMHAGNIPGFPASHGCIRLPAAFAKLLYGVTAMGMTVIITDDAPVPRLTPSPDLLTDDAAQPAPSQEMQWQPELATAGPISIIISAADLQLIVLRNGKQIGSAPITLRHSVLQPSAYMVRAVDEAGLHWLSVALPWDKPATVPVDEVVPEKSIVVDEGFRLELVKLLSPGTTVVITPDTLKAGSTGAPIVILSDDE